MYDDLLFNELFVSDIRGTSSDAYYINPGWATNGSIDAWINTDKIRKVVRPFMVPRDIDDVGFDDCECHSDGIGSLLNVPSEVM